MWKFSDPLPSSACLPPSFSLLIHSLVHSFSFENGSHVATAGFVLAMKLKMVWTTITNLLPLLPKCTVYRQAPLYQVLQFYCYCFGFCIKVQLSIKLKQLSQSPCFKEPKIKSSGYISQVKPTFQVEGRLGLQKGERVRAQGSDLVLPELFLSQEAQALMSAPHKDR